MVANWQARFPYAFIIWKLYSVKFVSNGPIKDNQAWIQTMAWRWTNDKPLPKQTVPKFYDII